MFCWDATRSMRTGVSHPPCINVSYNGSATRLRWSRQMTRPAWRQQKLRMYGKMGGGLRCLTGQDLAKFDYISVGRDGFIPVNVKPMEMIQLGNVTR
jgi:hypothetical protein